MACRNLEPGKSTTRLLSAVRQPDAGDEKSLLCAAAKQAAQLPKQAFLSVIMAGIIRDRKIA